MNPLGTILHLTALTEDGDLYTIVSVRRKGRDALVA